MPGPDRIIDVLKRPIGIHLISMSWLLLMRKSVSRFSHRTVTKFNEHKDLKRRGRLIAYISRFPFLTHSLAREIMSQKRLKLYKRKLFVCEPKGFRSRDLFSKGFLLLKNTFVFAQKFNLESDLSTSKRNLRLYFYLCQTRYPQIKILMKWNSSQTKICQTVSWNHLSYQYGTMYQFVYFWYH